MAHALACINKCGFAYVLTSGGGGTAIESADALRGLMDARELVPQHRTSPPKVIVGGGVRSGNISELVSRTQAHVYHSAALVPSAEVVDRQEVRALRSALDNESR